MRSRRESDILLHLFATAPAPRRIPAALRFAGVRGRLALAAAGVIVGSCFLQPRAMWPEGPDTGRCSRLGFSLWGTCPSEAGSVYWGQPGGRGLFRMDTRELAFLLARLQPPKSVVADPAEVLALRVVVGVLVAVIAKRNESTGEPAHSFINDLAAICQQALASARIVVEEGQDMETVRRDAIEHVNSIVGIVQFDDGRSAAN